jgi:ribosomal protein S7
MTKLNKQNTKHQNTIRFNKVDPVYDLWVINKFINGISCGGDKEHTQKHIYKAF